MSPPESCRHPSLYIKKKIYIVLGSFGLGGSCIEIDFDAILEVHDIFFFLYVYY